MRQMIPRFSPSYLKIRSRKNLSFAALTMTCSAAFGRNQGQRWPLAWLDLRTELLLALLDQRIVLTVPWGTASSMGLT